MITYKLFHDGSPYYIETSPLICRANQWTDFYMIGTFVMKELMRYTCKCFSLDMDVRPCSRKASSKKAYVISTIYSFTLDDIFTMLSSQKCYSA